MAEKKTALKDVAQLVRSDLLVVLTGESPFVADNIRAADDSEPLTVQVKELAAKGSRMTAEERELKDRLQWANGLYLDEQGRLAYPSRNLWVAIAEAARSRSLGTAIIERGGVLMAGGADMLLGYQGPDGGDWTGRELSAADMDALYKDPRFRLRVAVNGNPSGGRRKSMVMRMRAQFYPWRMQTRVLVSHDEVSLDDFRAIMEVAGRVGIGNGRKIGMGRFACETAGEAQ